MNKISVALDKVAETLESKGLIQEAYKIDKVADAVDAALSQPKGLGIGLEKEVLDIAQKFNDIYKKNPEWAIDKYGREEESFVYDFKVPKGDFEEASRLIKKLENDYKEKGVKLNYVNGDGKSEFNPPYDRHLRGIFKWGWSLKRDIEDMERHKRESTPEYREKAKRLENERKQYTTPGSGPDYFKYKGWEKDLK